FNADVEVAKALAFFEREKVIGHLLGLVIEPSWGCPQVQYDAVDLLPLEEREGLGHFNIGIEGKANQTKVANLGVGICPHNRGHQDTCRRVNGRWPNVVAPDGELSRGGKSGALDVDVDRCPDLSA